MLCKSRAIDLSHWVLNLRTLILSYLFDLYGIFEFSFIHYLRWIDASLGTDIKLITIDEVFYFQSDIKYTLVVRGRSL